MFSACRDYQLAVDGFDYERRLSVGGMTPALIDTLHTIDIMLLYLNCSKICVNIKKLRIGNK